MNSQHETKLLTETKLACRIICPGNRRLWTPPKLLFTQFLLWCRGRRLILFLANKPRQIHSTTARGGEWRQRGRLMPSQGNSKQWPLLRRCLVTQLPPSLTPTLLPALISARTHTPSIRRAIISTVIWRTPCALLSLKIGKMCWPRRSSQDLSLSLSLTGRTAVATTTGDGLRLVAFYD